MKKSLRKPETEARYQEHLKTLPEDYCVFCDKEKMKFENREADYKYWFVIRNEFEYDAQYKDNFMLVCRRHVESMDELTVAEFKEMMELIRDFSEGGDYDQTILNARPRQSMPKHFHWHICNF